MDRRAFFQALVLGGAALPGSLKAVSVPAAPQTFTFTQSVVRGMSFYGNVLLKPSVAVIERCKIVIPWRWRGEYALRAEGSGPLRVVNNTITYQQPPLWARVLRLDRH